MYSVNCRWSLIEVRAMLGTGLFGYGFSAVYGSHAMSETVGCYHTARPQSGFVRIPCWLLRYAIVCGKLRAFTSGANYTRCIRTWPTKRGETRQGPPRLDCANRAPTHKRTKVRTEEL